MRAQSSTRRWATRCPEGKEKPDLDPDLNARVDGAELEHLSADRIGAEYVTAVSFGVTSPFGDIVHHKQKVSTGQFSFTTAEAGNYLACFSADGRNKRLVVKLNLDWRVGIATKDWDSVAKKEKLEGVELELVKLETSVQAIHENLLLLRSKEANMRDTSEKTNARATWLSIISLINASLSCGMLLLLNISRMTASSTDPMPLFFAS
uniref:GOLD domain-containing protein n=1 Tax=Oryza nivara TaxID=4536 RepID=A0A0E0GNB8_ORYNI